MFLWSLLFKFFSDLKPVFVLLFPQVTTLPEYPEVYAVVNKLRVESVVSVEGVVRLRPTESINADMSTGAIEVLTSLYGNLFNVFWG